MTNKHIKNEQWSVKQIMAKIDNGEINKPKFQRKRKWDDLPIKDNNPNEKSYIEFLFKTENSVHPITFGEDIYNKWLSNIDGNNRLNALKHFMNKPFDLFEEYLDDIKKFIPTLQTNDQHKDFLINWFKNISYNQIIYFKYTEFKNIVPDDLYKTLQLCRDEFEEIIEELQKKLKINSTEHFDTNVKINVNLFYGYTTDELCRTFEDINKYNSGLTETELLACKLFNETNFEIKDNVFKAELIESITTYYSEKSEGEILNCYHYNPMDTINAHDFIVGFQNLLSNKYKFICKTDVDGLSLLYKVYELLNSSYTFTTNSVNTFITKINTACEIFHKITQSIFTEKINKKLFNTTCQKKIDTLKKNNIFMILSSIIGFTNKNTHINIINNHIEKCLFYHFMVSDLKNSEKKEDFKNYDSITYRAGGQFIENVTKKLLAAPEIISIRLTRELFSNLIDYLYLETNNPYERKLENGKNKNDKRKPLIFFQKTLMFYFYKRKMSTDMLDNEFSIEHICPNSSEWEGEIDKDRTGNLIPIIASMNSSRGNKHIDCYSTSKDGKQFCNFISDIIPRPEIYNGIITHHKKPFIKDNELYNTMCDTNEERYKQNFIDCLFR